MQMSRSNYWGKTCQRSKKVKLKLENKAKIGDETEARSGYELCNTWGKPQRLLGAKRVKVYEKVKLRLQNTVKTGDKPVERSGYELCNFWGQTAANTGGKMRQSL